MLIIIQILRSRYDSLLNSMDMNWYLVESSEASRQRRNKPPLPTRVPSRFDATNSIPLLHYTYKVIFELRRWQSFSSRDEKSGIRRYIFDLIDNRGDVTTRYEEKVYWYKRDNRGTRILDEFTFNKIYVFDFFLFMKNTSVFEKCIN